MDPFRCLRSTGSVIEPQPTNAASAIQGPSCGTPCLIGWTVCIERCFVPPEPSRVLPPASLPSMCRNRHRRRQLGQAQARGSSRMMSRRRSVFDRLDPGRSRGQGANRQRGRVETRLCSTHYMARSQGRPRAWGSLSIFRRWRDFEPSVTEGCRRRADRPTGVYFDLY